MPASAGAAHRIRRLEHAASMFASWLVGLIQFPRSISYSGSQFALWALLRAAARHLRRDIFRDPLIQSQMQTAPDVELARSRLLPVLIA